MRDLTLKRKMLSVIVPGAVDAEAVAVGGTAVEIMYLKIIFVTLLGGAKWMNNPICYISLNREMN